MTLIEAIKSGKRFKRTSWYSWHTTKVKVLLSFEDVLANDWETEPVAVTITKEQFWQAYAEALKENFVSNSSSQLSIIDIMAGKLGL